MHDTASSANPKLRAGGGASAAVKRLPFHRSAIGSAPPRAYPISTQPPSGAHETPLRWLPAGTDRLVHLVPSQVSAVVPPTAMQDLLDLQDRLVSWPLPVVASVVQRDPFHRSANIWWASPASWVKAPTAMHMVFDGQATAFNVAPDRSGVR